MANKVNLKIKTANKKMKKLKMYPDPECSRYAIWPDPQADMVWTNVRITKQNKIISLKH